MYHQITIETTIIFSLFVKYLTQNWSHVVGQYVSYSELAHPITLGLDVSVLGGSHELT